MPGVLGMTAAVAVALVIGGGALGDRADPRSRGRRRGSAYDEHVDATGVDDEAAADPRPRRGHCCVGSPSPREPGDRAPPTRRAPHSGEERPLSGRRHLRRARLVRAPAAADRRAHAGRVVGRPPGQRAPGEEPAPRRPRDGEEARSRPSSAHRRAHGARHGHEAAGSVSPTTSNAPTTSGSTSSGGSTATTRPKKQPKPEQPATPAPFPNG